MKILILLLLLACEKPQPPKPEPVPTTPPVKITGDFIGVTIDSQDYKVADNLAAHKKQLWARIVFDEFVAAKDYLEFVNYVSAKNPVMGELLDSFYVPKYSVDAYAKRTKEYLDTFGDRLEILEIFNEINGEWLGNSSDVAKKLRASYDIAKPRAKKIAITLYLNDGCYEKLDNEMFNWAQKYIPADIKNGLDYVLVSYYQEDCENKVPDWSKVFAKLKVMFPNSYIGIGESGLGESFMKKHGTPELIKASIDRCYNVKIIDDKWKLGCFYWYYNKHMAIKGEYWKHLDSKL